MLSTKTIVLTGAGIATAAGLALVGASIAGADQVSATSAAYGYGHSGPGGEGGQPPGEGQRGACNTDGSAPTRSAEQLLTGDTATKVTAAAKAKEPDATIERVETDSKGIYQAKMVRADGTHITVKVGADFQVTGVTEHKAGGRGHQAGQPPAGGQGGGTPPTSGSTGSSSS